MYFSLTLLPCRAIAAEWSAELTAPKKTKQAAAAEKAVRDENVAFEWSVTGMGKRCKSVTEQGSTLKVHYMAKVVRSGKIFDSSFHTGSNPVKFVLGGAAPAGISIVAAAWSRGLEGMCVGERRKLVVPWSMAYGAKGAKNVPGHANIQASRHARCAGTPPTHHRRTPTHASF